MNAKQISLSRHYPIWQGLSYLFVLVFLGSGTWWMFHLPTVGKGGLFLAAGATLMPLFWEKIGPIGKMSWIAMVFLLLGVEYRAIDEEHRKNDLAQKEALITIGNGFTGVLTDQRNGFSALIEQSQEAFKKTTEQASSQFDAAMLKSQESLNNLTGGDSYFSFKIAEPMPPFEVDSGGIKKGSVIAEAYPGVVGKYPLHNVYVAPFCATGWHPSVDYGTVFPGELGRPRQTIYLHLDPDRTEQTCDLNINSSNGSYLEQVHFIKQDKKWVWAMRLMKYREKKFKYEEHSSGFPPDKLHAPWPT